jgi:hypothetical protein
MSVGYSVTSPVIFASPLRSPAPQTATTSPARTFIGPDGNHLPFENDNEVMEFLRTAKVTKRSDIGTGINRFKKLTLEKDGVRTHAIFRDADLTERNIRVGDRQYRVFRDSYLFECAAYDLGRLLGINKIPPVVLRRFGRTEGSLQLWIEDVRDEEHEAFAPPNALAWARQVQEMQFFDNLIFNVDRNPGNVLVTHDYVLILIDQTRGFQQISALLKSEGLSHLRRGTWERLRSLREEELRDAVRPYLTVGELSALVARWKLIVEHFDELIEYRGEELVLH